MKSTQSSSMFLERKSMCFYILHSRNRWSSNYVTYKLCPHPRPPEPETPSVCLLSAKVREPLPKSCTYSICKPFWSLCEMENTTGLDAFVIDTARDFPWCVGSRWSYWSPAHYGDIGICAVMSWETCQGIEKSQKDFYPWKWSHCPESRGFFRTFLWGSSSSLRNLTWER